MPCLKDVNIHYNPSLKGLRDGRDIWNNGHFLADTGRPIALNWNESALQGFIIFPVIRRSCTCMLETSGCQIDYSSTHTITGFSTFRYVRSEPSELVNNYNHATWLLVEFGEVQNNRLIQRSSITTAVPAYDEILEISL